jgi:hypothetical protein
MLMLRTGNTEEAGRLSRTLVSLEEVVTYYPFVPRQSYRTKILGSPLLTNVTSLDPG